MPSGDGFVNKTLLWDSVDQHPAGQAKVGSGGRRGHALVRVEIEVHAVGTFLDGDNTPGAVVVVVTVSPVREAECFWVVGWAWRILAG